MKNLYEVILERTTYQGDKSIETVQLFAASPKKINTYRLGGFQHDSIKILKTKKIRKAQVVELDVDIERNEIIPSVDVESHIGSTLEKNETLTKMIQRQAKKEGVDTEDILEQLGYHELCADNTYNYSSDFDNELNFKIYNQNKNADWVYDENSIVLVCKHVGLDVRGGYVELGLFNPPEWDGLGYFLEMHVRVTVETLEGDHVDDFDGDWAFGTMLNEYKIKSWDAKKQILIVTKDDQDFNVTWYHPAMGV